MDSRVSGGCARVPQDGRTALHAAAINGQTAVVEALLKRGANIETSNEVCMPVGEGAAARRRPDGLARERRVRSCAAGWNDGFALGGQKWSQSGGRGAPRTRRQPPGRKQGVQASGRGSRRPPQPLPSNVRRRSDGLARERRLRACAAGWIDGFALGGRQRSKSGDRGASRTRR